MSGSRALAATEGSREGHQGGSDLRSTSCSKHSAHCRPVPSTLDHSPKGFLDLPSSPDQMKYPTHPHFFHLKEPPPFPSLNPRKALFKALLGGGVGAVAGGLFPSFLHHPHPRRVVFFPPRSFRSSCCAKSLYSQESVR